MTEKNLRDTLSSKEKLSSDERVLLDRLNGRLTTLNIDGHTFYVDHFMQRIRPKDDFSTLGFRFSDLDDHFSDEKDRYEIPYNKIEHTIADIELDEITEVPKGIIAVAFPSTSVMDRVGYARAGGWSLENILSEQPQKAHFKAVVLKGKSNFLEAKIMENRAKKGLPPVKFQNHSRRMKK